MSKRIDIEGKTFNYWKVNYREYSSMYNCTCLLCGNKYTVESYKLRNNRSKCCKQCSYKLRTMENNKKYKCDIENAIKESGVDYVKNITIDDINIDFYIDDKKVAIKCIDTYDMNTKQKNEMQTDFKKCLSKSIRLINIFEYEWYSEDLKDKNIRLIKDSINNSYRRIIYARKTKVKFINAEEAKEFILNYHLQKYAPASINIGLFYNEELIGVMTFGYPRFNYEYQYELIRLTFKNDVNVIGGSEKMLKFFINQMKPQSILSYCSITKFSGLVYNRLGMKLIEYTSPNYMWVNSETRDVLPRYKCMKQKLINRGLGTPDMTEDQIMRSHGYSKVYDCGSTKYGWIKNNG